MTPRDPRASGGCVGSTAEPYGETGLNELRVENLQRGAAKTLLTLHTTSEAALAYARLGWSVFPLYEPVAPDVCSCAKGATCARDAGKHPRTVHGHLDATTDERQIRAWWTRWADANISVATGGGLLVVDVDGDDGARSLAALPELPATVEQATGRGRHLFFRVEGLAPTTKGRLGIGIDTRGEGGYVVAAPSLHRSGRRYAWVRPPWEVPTADAPPWLLEALARPCVLPKAGEGHEGPREGHKGEQGGPDMSDSGGDARAALRLVRLGASDAEIGDALRDQPSYRKRLPRGAHIAEDYLERTIAFARLQPVRDPWAGAIRVRVVGATFEHRHAKPWRGQPALNRVRLDVANERGELLRRQSVVVPDAAHAEAAAIYGAVFSDLPPGVWRASELPADLMTVDVALLRELSAHWHALAAQLVGRELEIVLDATGRAIRMRRTNTATRKERI